MNPIQIINQILNNNMPNNPIMKNAIEMYRNGNSDGLKDLATNLCREQGIDINKQIESIKQLFK